MSTLLEILTPRLRLRQWRDDDHERFARLCADPLVMQFLLPFPSSVKASELVDRYAEHISEKGWGFWVAEVRQSRHFAGFAGIQMSRLHYPFSPCVELGYRLSTQFWGNGLATEAARASLAVGFEHLGLEEIVSFCAAGNTRSRRVMEAAGMTPAGHFRHPAMPEGHPLRKQCLSRIAREEWAGLPRRMRISVEESPDRRVLRIEEVS